VNFGIMHQVNSILLSNEIGFFVQICSLEISLFSLFLSDQPIPEVYNLPLKWWKARYVQYTDETFTTRVMKYRKITILFVYNFYFILFYFILFLKGCTT